MVLKKNMSLRYSAFMCKTFILKWNLQTCHGGLSKVSYVTTAMSHIVVVFCGKQRAEAMLACKRERKQSLISWAAKLRSGVERYDGVFYFVSASVFKAPTLRPHSNVHKLNLIHSLSCF